MSKFFAYTISVIVLALFVGSCNTEGSNTATRHQITTLLLMLTEHKFVLKMALTTMETDLEEFPIWTESDH